jgi:hypothetical protein
MGWRTMFFLHRQWWGWFDDSSNRHLEMTKVYKTLWNQLSGKYEVGDTHLLGMLYSMLYNQYTCATSHRTFLQELGLLTSLDNLLVWWTQLQVIYWLPTRWFCAFLECIFFPYAWPACMMGQWLICAKSPPMGSRAYLISAMQRHPYCPREKWWAWVPIWDPGLYWIRASCLGCCGQPRPPCHQPPSCHLLADRREVE